MPPLGLEPTSSRYGELAQTTTLQRRTRHRAVAQPTRASSSSLNPQTRRCLTTPDSHRRHHIQATLTSALGLLRHDQASPPGEGTSTYASASPDLERCGKGEALLDQRWWRDTVFGRQSTTTGGDSTDPGDLALHRGFLWRTCKYPAYLGHPGAQGCHGPATSYGKGGTFPPERSRRHTANMMNTQRVRSRTR